MKPESNKTKSSLYKRTLLIKALGLILLVGGLFSLFACPAEFTSFYAFSKGGTYHYDGFGFGSFMFAFIIFNVIVYFFLALFGISLGIGNFKLKKWGYNLSLASLKAFLILGVAITISILFSFNLLKTLEFYQSLIIFAFTLTFLIILPYLLIKFYKNKKTKKLFNNFSSNSFFEKQSSQKLTIIILNLFWISTFYLLIFLKGTFPLFGKFVFTIPGTYILSMTIFILLILTYFFYKENFYAKHGMIVYYILLFSTFITTFLINSTKDLFNLLNLPVYELEKVLPAFKIPAGINLGIFFGVLIIIQLYLLIKPKTIR